MTDNEKIAALAAALDEMKAERNWYRTAWSEAFRERDEAQFELRKHYGERGPTCVKWLAEGGMREVLDILSQPHPVNVSEAAAAHLERGLGTNMIWARQVVAQINAWWQAVLEQDEEFGL